MFQTSSTTDQPKKSRRLLPLLSGVLLVAVLVGALVFSISARNGAYAASVASTSCATRQSDSTASEGFGNVEIWIRMTTSWCFNGITVTSHNTSLAWGITTLGKLAGYRTINGPDSSFNCYVAAGAPTGGGCSGNHEWAMERFYTGEFPAQLEVDLTINQEENYRGNSLVRHRVDRVQGDVDRNQRNGQDYGDEFAEPQPAQEKIIRL